jgi:signal transduction histidine kinase
MLVFVRRPPDATQAADRAAFHAHIGELNRRRMVLLASATAVLLILAATLNLIGGSRITDSGVIRNFAGLAMCLLTLALARWSARPGLAAIVYGYCVLGWGDTIIWTYEHELDLGHAAHAAQQFVVFFVTRYLAAMSVVWRPRTLAFALAVNHAVAMWPLLPRGVFDALFYPGIWTATAFLVAHLIYRAERDAFIARRGLQRQRDELAKANAHLEQLNQEKNDLMAIAAHDLRSPLMGMTTLLNMAAADAARVWTEGVKTLRALEQSGRDMADLVTRVLDAHQAEDGVGKLSLAAADIRPIVSRAVESHQPRAGAKAITLTIESPDEPCLAMLDAHALGRVLDNLGSNAIKFSPRGGTVRVRVQAGRNGHGPAIAVSDTGPGIGEEERPRLFRKFARLRARPTEGESSSGLGLYIVKRLVDAMGGSIAVSGAAGEGATFTVTLQPSA